VAAGCRWIMTFAVWCRRASHRRRRLKLLSLGLVAGLQQAALGQLGGTAAEAQLAQAGMGQFRSSDEEALLGQAAMGQFQRGAGEMQLGQAGMGQFQRGAGEMQLGQAGMGQLQQAGMGEMQLNKRGMDLLNREAGASPLQTRNAIQQARIASQARGRLGDASSVYGEIGARLSADLDLESRNLGLGSQLLGQSFGMGQQRLGTGAQFVGQEFGMGQQRLGTGAQLLGQEFGMGQQRTGTAAQLLSQRFGMGQQRLGTGAQLLGQEFGIGQQRLGTASNIYGQDLSRDQANAAMQQQTALANQQAAMSGRGMDLQGLLGLGQLQQSQQQGNRSYAMNLVGARQATSSDPFAAILGRTSGASGQGMAHKLHSLRLDWLASSLGLTSLIQTLALTLPSRIRPTRATTRATSTGRRLALPGLKRRPEVL
jgi:hypothetical protein